MRKLGVLLLLVFFLLSGVSHVMAAEERTQGDAALQLAALLGFNTTSAENAVAALQSAGINPPGGWNVSAPVTSTFVGQVFNAVSSAISAGRVAAPASLGNASAAVAAVFTAIGMSSSSVVNSIASAGGNASSASQGASFGTAVASTGSQPSGAIGGTFGAGGGEPGGGRGGEGPVGPGLGFTPGGSAGATGPAGPGGGYGTGGGGGGGVGTQSR